MNSNTRYKRVSLMYSGSQIWIHIEKVSIQVTLWRHIRPSSALLCLSALVYPSVLLPSGETERQRRLTVFHFRAETGVLSVRTHLELCSHISTVSLQLLHSHRWTVVLSGLRATLQASYHRSPRSEVTISSRCHLRRCPSLLGEGSYPLARSLLWAS